MATPKLRRTAHPTLAQALARYLVEISSTKKSAVTERSIASIWTGTRLAGRPIDRIRNTDIIAVRDKWLEQHKPATVVRRLAMLSHLYTVLRKDWGWPELANPVQLVRRPLVDDARERRLYTSIRLRGVPQNVCPRSELQWLIDATDSAELPAIMLLATETAMRRSEITGIRRENIDLRHGIVLLPDTKNGSSRNVPLTPWALDVLRRYLADKPARGTVFTLSPGAVTRAFIRARQRARAAYESLCRQHGRRPQAAYFRDLRFHDLRHEATSVLADVFEMHKLAKVTGHKDTRMLLRYYHPDGRDLARQLARSPLGRAQTERIRAMAGSSMLQPGLRL